jgi:hypothetical protein
MSDDRKEIDILCMNNNCMRKVINNLKDLFDLSAFKGIRSNQWKLAESSDSEAMVQLCRKEDFAPEEVPPVQKKLDIFFQNWMNLWGWAGLTNYIHMLGTGHIADYLLSIKNLY